MFTNVPLTMSSTYFSTDGSVHTYYPPNPIKRAISPLGSAVFSDGLLVSSYSNNPTTIVSTSALSDSIIYSPTSSIILSPYSYTRTPSAARVANDKKKTTVHISAPVIVPRTTTYIDVNSDPDLHKRMSKVFFEKLANNWLKSDFDDLLDYLVVKGGKVKLVSKLSAVKSNKTKGSDYDKKIDYIIEEVMTKYDVRSFLKKFITKTGINWYDLREHSRLVQKSMHKRMKRKLEKLIEEN